MHVVNTGDAIPIGIGIGLAPRLAEGVASWFGADRFVQIILSNGILHSLAYATKNHVKSSSVISEVGKAAFSYYSLGNLLWSIEYLVEPLLRASEESNGKTYILTALSATRSAITILGISHVGSVFLRNQLQRWLRKEDYGNLAERVAEASKKAILAWAVIHHGSNPNASTTMRVVETLFVAVTASYTFRYALEYVLKTRWAQKEDSTREWQQGFQDKAFAEKISLSAMRVLLSAIAGYSIGQYVPAFKWPANILCGGIALVDGLEILLPGYLKIYKNWHHQDRTVQLAGRLGRLYYRIYDGKTHRFLKEYPLKIRDRQEERSTILSKCTVLDSSKEPYTEMALAVWKGNEEVSLLKIRNRLIVFVENTDGEVGYSRFSVSDHFQRRFQSFETQDELQGVLKGVEKGDPLMCRRLEQLIKPVSISSKEKEHKTEAGVPINREVTFFINFSHSRIDSRFSLSEYCWGVSMIRHNGDFNQHTALIIEGMEAGEYVMWAAELNGVKHIARERVEREVGIEKRYNFSPSDVEWEGRTCVFKIKKHIVSRLLDDIEKERKGRAKGSIEGYWKLGNLSRLNFSKSVDGVGQHSCFTWARLQLRMIGIEIGKSKMDYIAAVPGLYMYGESSFRDSPYPRLDWIEQQQLARHEV